MEPVPAYLHALRDQFLASFEAKAGVHAPRIYAMRVACKNTFGGRWFAPGFHNAPGPSVVVILSGRDYERGVLLHELTHWGRWVDAQDKLGRHDKPFLAEVEKAYQAFSIPTHVALDIEHHPTGFLAGRGACLGTVGRARGRVGRGRR